MVDKSQECWYWRGWVGLNGYGYITEGGRKGKQLLAHRVAWVLANGRGIPEEMCVCHRCDNRTCVKPDHLFLATDADNAIDMWAKGRGCGWNARLPSVLRPITTPVSPSERFWSHVRKTPDCWYWEGTKAQHGYGHATSPRPMPAHRAAWELTHGPIPPGILVCHKCDVRMCVRPDHLFLGTYQDNMADAKAKGRLKPPPLYRGEQHPRSRLTNDLVRQIRDSKDGCWKWSRRLGLGLSTIKHVRNGRTWCHV